MVALMVWGTSSWAGKSLVTTALCRHFARLGVSVAPFKGQNMANNARVVDGGEIGSSQYLQALAAGVVPDVRMNPVLLKPEAGTSQVVVLGQVDRAVSRLPWRDRAAHLRPVVLEALHDLHDQYDLVVMEGAGSPAEINLSRDDIVNLAPASAVDAAAILVTDIDRGGAFASLVGTHDLLEPAHRRRLVGFVLNKFRGDASLLPPAPELVEERTGVPTLGVLPMLDHALPDEDGADPHRRGTGPVVALVRYPTASNLDEYAALATCTDLRHVFRPADLPAGPDLVILPGSKHVSSDRDWLEASGVGAAVRRAAADGARVVGVCGGLQLLGTSLAPDDDPGHVGHEHGGDGLDLLPLVTTFDVVKTTVASRVTFAPVDGPFDVLSGIEVEGYEIRVGRSRATSTGPGTAPVGTLVDDHRGWARGNVAGWYLHGMFEDHRVLRALLGVRPMTTLEETFDGLADALVENLDLAPLERLLD
ncbi:cobyric acid synthase [Salsipaludibacter albus]|uniref:cobyric acid synthase n=1 Tax=Salsipaludibacter albus TaxID=2849650 RepID=UPI001EE4CE2D|nr:cobyric acid synthase [Salsipaludibacter albus]MBY5162548.1 cobyric acid synthase [Salsipaludibacter albus]